MKTSSVESLCLAIGVLVLLMSATLAFALTGIDAVPTVLPWLFGTLAALALAALWRIRSLAAARSALHDRSRSLQRRYNYFVNTAHEGVWMVDTQGKGLFANARLAAMFGCEVGELLGRKVGDFLGDNSPTALAELLATHGAHAGRTYDLCYRRSDGSFGWAIASGRPASAEDGMPGGILLLLTDITVRKQAEMELAAVKTGLEMRILARTAELQKSNAQLRVEVAERQSAERALSASYAQLRQLTAHLETIKEQERKRIALDIHDDLGQNLMALKIDVQLLHARCAALPGAATPGVATPGPAAPGVATPGVATPGLKDELGRTLETIDASIRAARAIMNDLHPSTLELGLPAAAEWLLAQFEGRSGIASSLTVRGAEEASLDERSAALVFRIIEEALINIELHAGATQVEVLLAVAEQEVAVTLLDDGNGLYPGRAGDRARAMLERMRERVNVFGGQLTIQPRPATGSCLTFRIPLGGPPDADPARFDYNRPGIEIN